MTLIILLGGSSCIHSVIYFWRIKELKRAAKGQIFRVCKCFSSDKRRSDLTAVDTTNHFLQSTAFLSCADKEM